MFMKKDCESRDRVLHCLITQLTCEISFLEYFIDFKNIFVSLWKSNNIVIVAMKIENQVCPTSKTMCCN